MILRMDQTRESCGSPLFLVKRCFAKVAEKCVLGLNRLFFSFPNVSAFLLYLPIFWID